MAKANRKLINNPISTLQDMDKMQNEETGLLRSTKTDWFIHEVRNSLSM